MNLDPLILQNYLVIVPAYNESAYIAGLVEEIRGYGLDVVVVDDGSSDDTAAHAEQAGAKVLRHETNLGKGRALATGFRHAQEHGYDAVITMDADRQHDPADLLRFCSIYNRTGIPVLVGNRMADRRRIPQVRRYTNQFMSWILRRHMQQYIADTQNGFRLYQTDAVAMVSADSEGFAAESEVLLKLDEIGVRMGSVPVKARYGDEVSSIHPIKDTRRFFKMLAHYTRRKRQALSP